MLGSALVNKFLLLQVAGYCIQKVKFDHFELTLDNLNTIYFYYRPEMRDVFSFFRFLEERNIWSNKLYEPFTEF